MKFLLVGINSKYIHTNPAIYSLYAYSREYENNMELAEYTINQSIDYIVEDIILRKPDAIGFSCYIWNIEYIYSVAGDINKILPNINIWLGGPEASYSPQRIVDRMPFIKGIMVGEGEATYKELLELYIDNDFKVDTRKYVPIKGLFINESNGIYTGDREPVNIDGIPFIYDEGLKSDNRIIYYESSRGCPYNCAYCLSGIDKTIRFRNLNLVYKELEFFLAHKVDQVKFIDRTFNCDSKRALNIWKYLHEHDNGITNFHFEIAADIINDEQLELFSKMRPGLIQLEIGVQTTNEDTLLNINRKTNIDAIRKVTEKIKSYNNIHMHLDLIAGLPLENMDSFINSFNEVYNMGANQLQLGFLKVLSGTRIEENIKKYGIVYSERPPYEVLFTDSISYVEIRKLKHIEEMVDVFFNSGQFENTVSALVQRFSSPFEFYSLLAGFYDEKGYNIYAPSRHKRYEILLDFACEYDSDRLEYYRELLTHDYYLRENAKTRPSFAKDMEPLKERIKNFYMSADNTGKYLGDFSQYNSKQLSKMTALIIYDYDIFSVGVEPIKSETTALYIYDKRNPLNMNATCVRIP